MLTSQKEVGCVVVTDGHGRRLDERLVGVPQVGDLVGHEAVELGDYAVARMAPGEFEQFIASIRDNAPADAAPRRPSAGWVPEDERRAAAR